MTGFYPMFVLQEYIQKQLLSNFITQSLRDGSHDSSFKLAPPLFSHPRANFPTNSILIGTQTQLLRAESPLPPTNILNHPKLAYLCNKIKELDEAISATNNSSSLEKRKSFPRHEVTEF